MSYFSLQVSETTCDNPRLTIHKKLVDTTLIRPITTGPLTTHPRQLIPDNSSPLTRLRQLAPLTTRARVPNQTMLSGAMFSMPKPGDKRPGPPCGV